LCFVKNSTDYDRDLDVIPNLRQRIEREIELELKSTPQPPCNTDQTPTYHPFLSEFPDLLASSTRPSRLADKSDPNYQSDGSKDSLDIERFNIPYPDDHTSLNDWEDALSNAKSQLEHQRLRLINLDLIGKHGANHWKLSNFLVDQEISKVDKLVDHYKNEIDNVNRRRKAHQVSFMLPMHLQSTMLNHILTRIDIADRRRRQVDRSSSKVAKLGLHKHFP
jgi:pre-mRNA-splicing factor SPF27